MIAVETIPGMGGGGYEGEQQRGCVQAWHIWCIVRTFVNATMYPHPAKKKKKFSLNTEISSY
jgi:hypothetical protein